MKALKPNLGPEGGEAKSHGYAEQAERNRNSQEYQGE